MCYKHVNNTNGMKSTGASTSESYSSPCEERRLYKGKAIPVTGREGP
jgi:hypothetical protein